MMMEAAPANMSNVPASRATRRSHPSWSLYIERSEPTEKVVETPGAVGPERRRRSLQGSRTEVSRTNGDPAGRAAAPLPLNRHGCQPRPLSLRILVL